MSETLASRFFRTWWDHETCDGDLYDAIKATGIPCEHYHCDHYDNSIEVYTVGPKATDEWLAALFAMGFDKVYWHHSYSDDGPRGSANNANCTPHLRTARSAAKGKG